MRYREAWTLASKGKREEAEKLATELLIKPRLGPIHKAGMHMLMATSSQDDFLDHARKSAEIYEAILTNDLTAVQRAQMEEVLPDAKVVLERAHGDQSAIDREISKKLTTMTMSQKLNRRM
ncbi:hypothetical protein GCG54_00006128 [Colletotrichum gloeosporioides]|uniref:Tetratricopeptide repeat protein n=1 Tax=Colletotrichum gloeosporioides TaxID=474922 RepID=A0A8H4CM21_COLGL|nr:uncharacterized protein GCG54_00006128 [Colletotrichum gloeosporioides]KAF3806366.1 hypothetical protein GCG54_00006128 [Colletotrichum gloeosporioides]